METTSAFSNADPFAAQRTTNDDPFAAQRENTTAVENNSAVMDEGVGEDPRHSKEWDASKVPPSQFQKRKGSIYSTPSSKDSQHHDKERDKAFHDKLKEKGWNILGKKS